MIVDVVELARRWSAGELWIVHDPKTLEGFLMDADTKEIIPNTEKPYLVNHEFDSILYQLRDANIEWYRSRYDRCT